VSIEDLSESTGAMYVQVTGGVVFSGSSLTLVDLAPATTVVTSWPEVGVGYLPTGLFLDRWYAYVNGTGMRSVAAVLSVLDPDVVGWADARLMLSMPRIRGTGLEYRASVVDGRVPAAWGASVLFISPRVPPTTPHASMRSPSGEFHLIGGVAPQQTMEE
jgi:hypothetical protein